MIRMISPNDKLAVVVIVLVLNVALAPNYFSYAAAQAQQQQQQQPQIITSTDRNLTASINGDSFKAGDTIRVNGTVSKQGLDPSSAVAVNIQVGDPKNRIVENTQVFANPINREFRHEFVAGLVEQFDPDGIMQMSGNYTLRVIYVPPYLYGQENPREMINFTFAYRALE